MIAGLSESLTLTLVLLLVFGSACLYLYTRISQTEQKISLIESILLDLKMASDLRHVQPDLADDSGEESEGASGAGVGGSGWAGAGASAGAGPRHSSTDFEPPMYSQMGRTSDLIANDDFADVLQSAHSMNGHLPVANLDLDESPVEELAPEPATVAAPPTEETSLANDAQSSVGGAPLDMTTQEIPFERLDEVTTTVDGSVSHSHSQDSGNVRPNLESMTAKELHSLAKQRGVSGGSKMTRAQLIDALRPSPVGTVAASAAVNVSLTA